jgi:leader peptidase (prepilin peptidase)/N-methyltransferase
MRHFFETYPQGFIGLCAIIGLAINPLLSILIHRLPMMMRRQSGLSLWQPRSHCPQCQHILLAQDTIPLLSYFLLKGKCRYCSTLISQYYPLVELVSMFLSAALAWRFGPTWALIGALCLSWGLIVLTAIDLTHLLLPDSVTLPLLWAGLAFNLFDLFTPLPNAVFGAMLGYLFLWSISHLFRLLTGKEGIGYGDFKLLAAVGAWLGYDKLPVMLVLSASVAILIRITLFRQKIHAYFAFGPYLCLAALIVLFW